MKRREFIALLGGAAAWPGAVDAQQPAVPVIGYLADGLSIPDSRLAAFRRGLKETGYVEGQNVAIEYRWAGFQADRLLPLATDLVHQKVAVIVTEGMDTAAVAAKVATTTTPIVFQGGGDPIRLGLVASLPRPGGNVTGVTNLSTGTGMGAKRVGLLNELVPTATTIALLVNPNTPTFEIEIEEVQAASRSFRKNIIVIKAGTEREIDTSFAALIQQKAEALSVAADRFFVERRDQLAALGLLHKIPVIYSSRNLVDAGGLISYGADLSEVYRHVGIYAGKILKSAKPADLPVVQPTKFELVINLKTAKALGLTIPATLLARADEVIE
jgi:putative ABC transport system substrate-binding protein